ncbi:MAG TPA: hypothetical protein VH134_16335 [Candidatus Dormibacteraeota bacterium]|nr:hypothetical protein [Candidatus Dormibacteraeota bacterium]
MDDVQHYAEVELTPQEQPVRGWRVVCACGWTGLWRGSLAEGVAEYDGHLAENGIIVFDGSWWTRLPQLQPSEEIAPDPVALSAACQIWAVEASAELDRLCRWVRTPENDPGR